MLEKFQTLQVHILITWRIGFVHIQIGLNEKIEGKIILHNLAYSSTWANLIIHC